MLPEQLQDPVSYDDVELTEEETAKALHEARVRKAAIIEDERRKKLAAEMKLDLMKPWTPNQLWEFAKQRGNRIIQLERGPEASFQVLDMQKHVIHALCLYFTGDKRFEELDPNLFNQVGIPFLLNKGLWLWGNPGVGKTLLMQMFRINKRQCFDLIQCPKLCYHYVKHGDDVINPYKRVVQAVASPDNFYQKETAICYNDLGTEPLSSKHYGNPINVMETIFLETYENKVPWSQRHVTTNLTFDQVESSYGLRVKDRIRQCFNIIDINGESLRR